MKRKTVSTNGGSDNNQLDPPDTKLNNLTKTFKNYYDTNLPKKLFIALCCFVCCAFIFVYALFARFYVHEANILLSLRTLTKNVHTIQTNVDNLEEKYKNVKNLHTQFEKLDKKVKENRLNVNNENKDIQIDDLVKLKNVVSELSQKVAILSERFQKTSKIDSDKHSSHVASRRNQSLKEQLRNLFKNGISITKISD